MKRYTDANHNIHVPADLRNRTIAGETRRMIAPRRVVIVATAAVLLAALGLGAALLRPDDNTPPVTPVAPDIDALGTVAASPFTGPTPTETGEAITFPTDTDPVQPLQPIPPTQTTPTLKLTEVVHTAQPQYPPDYERDAYKAWSNARQARWGTSSDADAAALASTSTALMQQFLTSTDKTAGQNRVISPLNLYLALAMLAETTDGSSCTAVLNLLGADTIETARRYASSLFTAHYVDDGLVKTNLAASIWLRDGFPFKQSTLDKLAVTHHAEAYSGKMGSPDLNAALQEWLNANTGGLLREQVSGVEFDPDTVIGLATTIYYSARWDEEFRPELTAKQTFHASTGDIEVDFMHSSGMGYYYDGKDFGAVRRSLTEGSMWLILPDEGVSPDELLARGDLLALSSPDQPADVTKTYARVKLALPRFDVTADLDLTAGLTALGLGDLFSAATADFSPLTEDRALADEIYLGSAQHAARVKIDEEGCEGAAYTLLMATATGGHIDVQDIDFVLDRPFIFLVVSATNAPLFAGVVEMP